MKNKIILNAYGCTQGIALRGTDRGVHSDFHC